MPVYFPRLLADSKNNIYLNTPSTLVVYNSEGMLIKRITKLIEGESAINFTKMTVIDINHKDQILVKDLVYAYQIDSNGTSIQPKIPLSIFFGTDGYASLGGYDNFNRIYASSKDFQCVKVFSNDGLFLKNIGGYKAIPTYPQIDPKWLVSKKTNNLVFAENSNRRIHAINYNAKTLWSVGDEIDRTGSINGFALDSMKNMYVLDSSFHRVKKFNPEGVLLKTWGNFGTRNGEFNYFTGISIDPSDKIYIRDIPVYEGEAKTRIQIFSSEGIFLENHSKDLPNFDKKGNQYYLIQTDTGAVIHKYDNNNNLIKELKVDFLKNISTYYYSDFTNEKLLIDSNESIFANQTTFQRGQEPQSSIIKLESSTGQLISRAQANYSSLGLDNSDSIYTDTLQVFDNKLKYLGSPIQTDSSPKVAIDKDNNIYSILSPNTENSGYSVEITKPLSKLQPPILKTIIKKGDAGAVTLKWQDMTNDETGFRVYRSKNQEGFQLVATIPANTVKLRFPAPTDFTQYSYYTYRLTAIKGEEESLALRGMAVNF